MQKFRIMLSSRCDTKIKDINGEISLSDIRSEAKKLLETAKLFDKDVFDVWINEESHDVNALESSWDACMSKVKKCDLLICIYTGEAGWKNNEGDIGICHAELESGFNSEPSKVYIIDASNALLHEITTSQIDDKFKDYVERLKRFHSQAHDKEQIIISIVKIAREGLVSLAKMGRREARKGKYNYGDALDWSRLNFDERAKAIIKTIKEQLEQPDHVTPDDTDNFVLIDDPDDQIGEKHQLVIHGCPGSMGVASAREIVGRPFLRDHIYVKKQPNPANGPVHLIGVHKGVTEQQALSVLGHPDAVVVEGPFGVYIADKIQNIQIVFLSNCRDATSTRHNVQRFMSWLDESGEKKNFYERSNKRKKIIDVIIEQQNLKQG